MAFDSAQALGTAQMRATLALNQFQMDQYLDRRKLPPPSPSAPLTPGNPRAEQAAPGPQAASTLPGPRHATSPRPPSAPRPSPLTQARPKAPETRTPRPGLRSPGAVPKGHARVERPPTAAEGDENTSGATNLPLHGLSAERGVPRRAPAGPGLDHRDRPLHRAAHARAANPPPPLGSDAAQGAVAPTNGPSTPRPPSASNKAAIPPAGPTGLKGTAPASAPGGTLPSEAGARPLRGPDDPTTLGMGDGGASPDAPGGGGVPVVAAMGAEEAASARGAEGASQGAGAAVLSPRDTPRQATSSARKPAPKGRGSDARPASPGPPSPSRLCSGAAQPSPRDIRVRPALLTSLRSRFCVAVWCCVGDQGVGREQFLRGRQWVGREQFVCGSPCVDREQLCV
jgi:hypothetical protein